MALFAASTLGTCSDVFSWKRFDVDAYAGISVRSVGAGVQTPAVGAIVPQIIPQEKLTEITEVELFMS